MFIRASIIIYTRYIDQNLSIFGCEYVSWGSENTLLVWHVWWVPMHTASCTMGWGAWWTSGCLSGWTQECWLSMHFIAWVVAAPYPECANKQLRDSLGSAALGIHLSDTGSLLPSMLLLHVLPLLVERGWADETQTVPLTLGLSLQVHFC